MVNVIQNKTDSDGVGINVGITAVDLTPHAIRTREVERLFYEANNIRRLEPVEFAIEALLDPDVHVMPALVDYWEAEQLKPDIVIPPPVVAVYEADGVETVSLCYGFEACELAKRKGEQTITAELLHIDDPVLVYDLRAHFAATNTPSSFALFLDSVRKSFDARWGEGNETDEARAWLNKRARVWGRFRHINGDLTLESKLHESVASMIIDTMYLGQQRVAGAVSRTYSFVIVSLTAMPNVQKAYIKKVIDSVSREFPFAIYDLLRSGATEETLLQFIQNYTPQSERRKLAREKMLQNPPGLNTGEEAVLIARAQDNDQAAMGELYERYYSGLFRYIFYRIGDNTETEDLAMEVFTRAMENIDSYTASRVHFSGWLYRIAHNLVINYFRRQPLLTPLSFEEKLNPGFESDELESAFTNHALREGFRYLTDDQRAVVILSFFEGLSNLEIANVLGKSEDAVKSLKHRGLNSLRRFLGEQGGVTR